MSPRVPVPERGAERARRARVLVALGALVVAATMAACTGDPPDLVRRTIGPAGGLVSSHDGVLTIVLQPGALTHEIELVPSDEPPLIFGPAYRVRPDIDLRVDAEITYRRVLPNDPSGVAVATIRLDDYTAEMGHWVPLPRLAIDEASGAVLASDFSLSLYYGMLEAGGGGAPTMGSDTEPGGDTDGSTGPDPTASTSDPTDSTSDPTDSTGDPTTGDPTDPTDPTTGGGCGDGVSEPGVMCFSATDYPMADGPVGVTLGDFDDDGRLDVATANDGGSFSVRLGDGTGALGTETSQIGAAIGTDLRGAIGGDLGGDAAGDAVVADFTEGGVYILIGNGAAGFVSTDFIATGVGAIDVTAGDFDGDGDGDDDLAVANRGTGTVTVLEKTGGSTWGNPTDYDVGGSPSGIASGDLDGDGIPDIVVSNATGDGLTVLASDP